MSFDPRTMTAQEHRDEAAEQLLKARLQSHGSPELQDCAQLSIAHSLLALSLDTAANSAKSETPETARA